MEDIKILEEILKISKTINYAMETKDLNAIENLLKRNKELQEEVESQDKTIDNLIECQTEREKYTHSLEEENKRLKKNYINPSKARISYYDTKKGTEVVIEGFIPISVIQNKITPVIDELEKDGFVGYADELRDIVDEILEKGNK